MTARKVGLFSNLCLFYRCNCMCDQFANKPQWHRKPSLFTSKKLESIIESALAPEKHQDVLFICQGFAFQNISHSVQMVLMYTQSPEVEHHNNSLLFHYLFIFFLVLFACVWDWFRNHCHFFSLNEEKRLNQGRKAVLIGGAWHIQTHLSLLQELIK